LYVVLFHAGLGFVGFDHGSGLSRFARALRQPLAYGHDAVAVFIVLSGYCLMLPVARAEGQLVRGLASYFARRAWRILPPYFATLFGSLLLLAVLPVLETATNTIWDDTSPAFTGAAITSHLFLAHNLFPSLAHRINGPLWSVATEWQIYFFFPLLLLPIWRRFGPISTVLTGFAVGSAFTWVAPAAAHSAASWYIGLFALGMCAAGIGFTVRPAELALRARVPWGPLSVVLLGSVAIGATALVRVWFRALPYSDALVGAATACSLVYLTRHALAPASEPRPWFLRCFEARTLVSLGRCSYSLYLTHLPVVAVCYFGLRRLNLSADAQLLALVSLSLPLSVLFSYGFYWLFERRFTGSPAAFFAKRKS
jgi:peptidoglycan/LPS O-acetylase OafA/YrhL